MGPTVATAPEAPVTPAPTSADAENLGPQNSNPNHTRKIKHRSSKPILAWVQRKFTGANNPTKHPKEQSGPTGLDGTLEERRPSGTISTTSGQTREVPKPRRASEPKQSNPTSYHATKTSQKAAERALLAAAATASKNANASMRKKAMLNQQLPVSFGSSVNGAGAETASAHGAAASAVQTHGSDSAPPSPRSTSLSFSGWSNPPEADDDASIRPLPPTSPPSPAPSRSTHHTISSYTSGGYLSDPKTFRSGAASTKPTTLLSIDVGHGNAAHIAQAPPSATGGTPSIAGGTGTAPSSPSLGRFPSGRGHAQGPSAASITFSTLPSGNRHPLASTQVAESGASDSTDAVDDDGTYMTQAPNLSQHHPRNNPRPLSPPLDNASMLTLASSTFAGGPRPQGTPSVASRFPVSVSGNYRGSSVTGLGLDGYEGDPDASVRALRPRSRRGSWGSMTSTETGWSAAVHALGPNTRRTGGEGSMRTGDGANEDGDEDMSIRHAQIDEEEDLDASMISNTTANGASPEPLAVPVVVIAPTPEASKSVTPMKEKEDPVQMVPVQATASQALKAKFDGEKQVEVAPADVMSVAVPVAKVTPDDLKPDA